MATAGERGSFIEGSESIVWAATILLLSIADALFTLRHVRFGASELNPLMGCLLDAGPGVFLTAKTVLSVLALSTLAAFLPRYRYARACFGGLGALYLAVCCYHLAVFVA